jgi:[protein-PII] uridylyltransferase
MTLPLTTVDRHQCRRWPIDRLEAATRRAVRGTQNVEVLFLAALLHDIGKGRQGDHSQLGAEMAVAIGQRLRLTPEECATLSFLIRHHLYLPENAMRRDFADREFIRQAADLIGDVERLTMLYLLTIADSKATGPSAWSNWKASLLAELYLSIKACLGADHHIDRGPGRRGKGVKWLREQNHGGDLAAKRHESRSRTCRRTSPQPESGNVLRHLAIHAEKSTRLNQQVLLFPGTRNPLQVPADHGTG